MYSWPLLGCLFSSSVYSQLDMPTLIFIKIPNLNNVNQQMSKVLIQKSSMVYIEWKINALKRNVFCLSIISIIRYKHICFKTLQIVEKLWNRKGQLLSQGGTPCTVQQDTHPVAVRTLYASANSQCPQSGIQRKKHALKNIIKIRPWPSFTMLQ